MKSGSPSTREYTTIPPPGSRERRSRGIQLRLNRWERRSLKRTLRKTKDAGLAKRCQIVLLRNRGWTYRLIAQVVGVSVGTVQRVLQRYKAYGQAGLIDRREDNGQVKVDEEFLNVLWEVLEHPAYHYRWPRPTWTIGMLIQTMAEKTGIKVSRSTMSRALHAIGARRGRPKPIAPCPWSKARKRRQLNKIRRIIENLRPGEVAVWADEVDVDLNPKIGMD
ncbi:MAG: helix-turn-helix domain-containing protein [Armatimonadota bacterium]|nr:helix-turn-helix domain-containing protein [Armatimonadota bacterium]